MLYRGSQDKNTDGLFAQIQSFVLDRENVLNSISQLQDDRERDVLSIFDGLKAEINDALDIAYQKYCNTLRTYHQTRLDDALKKFNILHNMCKVQTCIQERRLPSPDSEVKLATLAKLLSRYHDHTKSLSKDLEEKFNMLSNLVKDESHLTLSLDHKRLGSISTNILELIREQFKISDESNRNASTDSSLSDWSKEKTSYNANEAEICALVALKNDLVATAGRDTRVKLWDLRSGECVNELSGHQDAIWDLKSAFDGKYLISGSGDTTIKVWKMSERKCKKTFKGHTTSVHALAFIEEHKVLVSGAQDGSLVYWDMNEGKLQRRLLGHDRAIWTIQPLNTSCISTAGEDMNIKVWTITGGELLRSLRGHSACIFDISVYNSGKNFASCADDGVVLLWESEQWTVLDSLQAHEKGVRSLSVNNTGTLMATGGCDRVLRVWDLEKMCIIRENDNNDSVIRRVTFVNHSSLLYCDNNIKNYKFTKH